MNVSNRRGRSQQEAAEWWVILQGDASREQRAEYVDWLRESPVHVAEMLYMARVHGTLDQFERWTQQPTDGADRHEDGVVSLPVTSPSARTRVSSALPAPRDVKLAWPLAAMLLLLIALGALFFRSFDGEVIQTERGERREVSLPDGSVVQVDPETRLRVKYGESVRQIALESGRALFRVAKSPHRPFRVQSDNTAVQAVGTQFAVEREGQSVRVTVAEGEVAVLPGSRTFRAGETKHPSQPASGGAARRITLIADQQVVIPASGSAGPVRSVDSAQALAWAEGKLIFANEPLGTAVKQFNRYNQIQIRINDSHLARRPISGVFNADDPESFVALIEAMAPVRVTRAASADIEIDKAR
jgi:transmembrane sensor